MGLAHNRTIEPKVYIYIYVFNTFSGVSIQYIYVCTTQGQSWPSTYGSWIYNYPCNQCLSLFMEGVLDTTLSDKVCQ